MRRRRGRSRLPALLLALIAGAAGYALTLPGRAGLEEEIQRLERANGQLSANAGVLAEALRAARAPLQRHIFALEGRLGALELLAARTTEPADQAFPVDREPWESAPDLEPDPSPETTSPQLGSELLASHTPAEEAAEREASVESQAAPLAGADDAPASPPPVSAARDPIDVELGAGAVDLACRSLADADFALSGVGDETVRLAGHLAMSLWREGGELALHVAGDDASPYSLRELPLHFSFDCGDVPYIVSVCSRGDSAVAIRGSVSHAENWEQPCARARSS